MELSERSTHRTRAVARRSPGRRRVALCVASSRSSRAMGAGVELDGAIGAARAVGTLEACAGLAHGVENPG
jgi:hypothetical protein